MRTIMEAVRRHGGRRRAGTARDWPIGYRRSVDPWGDAPLFDPDLTKQAAAAARVTCGRGL